MRALLSGLMLALVAGAVAASDDPPPIGVTSRNSGGASMVEAVLPGRLLGWSVRTPDQGEPAIFLLVAPGSDVDGPRKLFRLHLADERLEELQDGLPEDVDDLLMMDDGSLLIGGPGQVYRLAAGQEDESPKRLQASTQDEMDLRRRPSRGSVAGERAANELHQAAVGRLSRYRLESDSFELEEEIPLPVRARRAPGELWLWSPKVSLLPRDDAPPIYAIGPEPLGSRRLRTILIDPTLEDEGRTIESWAQLPGAEVVQKSWYLWVDGTPYLAVSTGRAQGFGVFEKQQVRVYPVRADRTRTGRAPVLATKTTAHRWQWLDVTVTDFDSDGIDDIALLQTNGIGAGKFVIEVFFGNGSGGFELKPAKSGMEVPGRRWMLIPDMTGDGAMDLLGVTGDELMIFSSSDPERRRRVIEKEPIRDISGRFRVYELETEVVIGSQQVAMEREASDKHQPQLLDVDGDGSLEIVLAAGREEGRDVVRIIDLDK